MKDDTDEGFREPNDLEFSFKRTTEEDTGQCNGQEGLSSLMPFLSIALYILQN